MAEQQRDRQLGFGTTVYDADGTALGRVRGFDEHGFYVTADEGIEGLSIEHVKSGGAHGEAELMWRCWECGELGHLEQALPETCPSCGAAKEQLYYYTED